MSSPGMPKLSARTGSRYVLIETTVGRRVLFFAKYACSSARIQFAARIRYADDFVLSQPIALTGTSATDLATPTVRPPRTEATPIPCSVVPLSLPPVNHGWAVSHRSCGGV